MKVDSDPEDDSVLFSCGSSSTAVACAILFLLVFMHLALCSRRFSARRHVGTLGGRSSQFGRHFFTVRAFSHHRFFEPSSSRTCECSRAPGSPGVLTPS